MMMIMLLKAFPNLMPWCELARRHTIPVVRPANALERYPHEFSGGQRQRIGIARALSVELELIVADEPVSALDVLVQPQVLLLRELRERRGLAFLFVSHDLSVVRWFCGSVAVMYLGRIVEHGPVAEVLRAPLHPYANMLREASPEPDPARHPAQDHRRNPLRRRTATRLHLPPPLRRGAGGMCAGRAAAGAALGRARCRLPSLQPHIRRGLTQMHGCLALMGFA